jgi:hypothetical protein
MFIECCGDRPAIAYQRKDIASFYDLLLALPKLYSKSKEWRGLRLREIVAQSTGQECERLSMTTIKRHFFSALGRLFEYLKKRGEYNRENPAHGFKLRRHAHSAVCQRVARPRHACQRSARRSKRGYDGLRVRRGSKRNGSRQMRLRPFGQSKTKGKPTTLLDD